MPKEYPFTLNRAEQSTHLWKKVQAHLDYLLDKERKKNDGVLPPDTTNSLRGRISMLKELKNLDMVNETQREDSADSEES